MEPLVLTVVFRTVENGWTEARLAELPAVITAAPTRDEARELVLDALREYLLANGQEDGDAIDVERLEVVLQAT